jgi:hypothetical protein
MKRMLLAVLLIGIFSAASFAKELVAEGKTHSALGDYKVELAEKSVIINGEEFTPFVISYQNSPLEVRVAVRKDNDCIKYFVLSDNLSVQYVCKEDYFGVERLDKSFSNEGYATSDLSLDRNEYFHQKVLTGGQGCDLDHTMLIAAYFPRLLNSKVNSYAVK